MPGGEHKRAPADAEDGHRPAPAIPVSQAFSLGWNLARLYLSGESPCMQQWGPPPQRLPSPGTLSEAERSLIRLGQVKATIRRLDNQLASLNHDAALGETVEREVQSLEPTENGLAGSEDPRASLCSAHLGLGRALSCCDGRLAKSYQLGISLATTCYGPEGPQSLEAEFNRHRIAQLGEWLADLSALFPDHASRAVRISCTTWRRWVEDPQIKNNRIGKATPIGWEEEWIPVRRSLARQGEVWRALLADEKPATGMLELRNYVSAGGRALRNGIVLVRRLWPWLLAIVALFLFGLWALATKNTAGSTVAGIAAVTASLGISWKGVLGGIGGIVTKLDSAVWGAALDEEVGDAITILPPGADVSNEDAETIVPACGPNPEALALLEEVEAQPEWAV
jgi:hypothetical protein